MALVESKECSSGLGVSFSSQILHIYLTSCGFPNDERRTTHITFGPVNPAVNSLPNDSHFDASCMGAIRSQEMARGRPMDVLYFNVCIGTRRQVSTTSRMYLTFFVLILLSYWLCIHWRLLPHSLYHAISALPD